MKAHKFGTEKLIKEYSAGFSLKDYEKTRQKYSTRYKDFQAELTKNGFNYYFNGVEDLAMSIQSNLYDSENWRYMDFHKEQINEAVASKIGVRSALRQFRTFVNGVTFKLIQNVLGWHDDNRLKSYAPYATSFYIMFYGQVNQAMQEVFEEELTNLLEVTHLQPIE